MPTIPNPKPPEARRLVVRPNPGPQWDFIASDADIAIFGGAAGGGKTYGMLLDPLKRRDIPGFDAMVFRRVGAQISLPGGLWSSSVKLYPMVGGTGFPGKRTWRWPNGFTVSFRHLEDEAAIGALQGSQIPYIGFDELTHFTREQFLFLLSRNRSMTGIPGQIRATCNADSTSWVKDFIGWWLDSDGRYPDQSKSGRLRWMARDGDDIVWYGTKAEAEARHGRFSANSVTFIPARITDNQPLMETDPSYLTKLRGLGHVLRQQLEFGDWRIRNSAGMIFRREWFPIVRAATVEGTAIRYWDRASKKAGTDDSDMTGPDWTVGVRMRKTPAGRYVIEHVVRMRGTPGEVETAIRNTASQDGPSVMIGIEQDPGQAGVAEASYHVRNLPGYNVRTFPVTKAKLVRAGPLSAQCEAGNVSIVEGQWNDAFLRVLEAFPDGPKDDDVDAASGAFNALQSAYAVNWSQWGTEAKPAMSAWTATG